MGRRVRIIVVAVAMCAVVGGGVYLLLRPTADIDHINSAFSDGFGGVRALDEDGAGLRRRFAGKGTVIVAISALNTRDHEVELSVPKDALEALAHWGIEGRVLFVPLSRTGGYGNYQSEADLEPGTSTMPANAEGEIVHVFRVTRCLPKNTTMLALTTSRRTGTRRASRSARRATPVTVSIWPSLVRVQGMSITVFQNVTLDGVMQAPAAGRGHPRRVQPRRLGLGLQRRGHAASGPPGRRTRGPRSSAAAPTRTSSASGRTSRTTPTPSR